MALLAYNSMEAINHNLDLREQCAVEKIKSNPKSIFTAMSNLSKQ